MKMKKFTAILAAAMLLALTACGSEDKNLETMKLDQYVTLGEYMGLEIPVSAVTVTDEEVEELVVYIGQNYMADENGITDRAAQLGDTINLDYAGYLDGVAFEGGTAQAQQLTLGSGQFIPGFEDGLVGVNPGETLDLPLTFPETYGNTELETVIGNASIHEMPEGLVEECEQILTDSVNQVASMYGMDADTYLMYAYYTDLATYVSTYGEEVAKQHLVFMAIAQQEDLVVSDEEYDAILLEEAKAAGFETVEEYLGDADKALQKKYYILDKVLAFVTENAMLVEQ